MAVWSCLRNFGKLNALGNAFPTFKNISKTKAVNCVSVRMESHARLFDVKTSGYFFAKTKDMIIFYTLLGFLPLAALVTYVNVFIGPAELSLIPEDYEPKHWEYHRHPITRFIARYIGNSPQEVYERNLHIIFEKKYAMSLRSLQDAVKNKMREKLDYQAWYYDVPQVGLKRKLKEDIEEVKRNRTSSIYE